MISGKGATESTMASRQHSSATSSKSSKTTDKIVVAVRVRPMNEREFKQEKGKKIVVQMEGKRTDLIGESATSTKRSLMDRNTGKADKSFTYDYSFWSANPRDKHYINQEQVYDALGKHLLENAFKGFNNCIFAYGQTGSGKTHTMMGPIDDPGLTPRICNELFERIAANEDPNVKFRVECSYMEIYNERVRDLLAMSDKKVNLKVREHKILGPYVEGLRSFATKDFSAMNALILEGIKSRMTASTAMNDQSSRSHAVFNIMLTESTFDQMTGNTGEKTSRISLVDLAGSERVWRTGAEGDRLREGGSINKSLSTLGLVISNLADIASGKKTKESFIPYRDSVLTWLLKENLGGNSKTVMIATISPSEDSYEESLSTLRYADTAKRIQTYAVVNEDANAKMIRDLREEVEHLRQMLAAGGMQGTGNLSDAQMLELREKLAESERLMKEMSMSWEERLRIAHQVLEERAKQLKDMGISVQGGGISVDADKRYLLNLAPTADELTMYYLKETVTRVGSKKGQDIELKDPGVLPEHCILPVEGDQLFVLPLPGAKVAIDTVDGFITEKTLLTHGHTLYLDGKEFRVSCPAGRSASSARQPVPEAEEEGLPSGMSWPGSKFHRACEVGDMATVHYMLGNGQDVNSEDARWKRAPLMLAADHGHTEVCKLLMKHNAVAGKADDRGYTPLHACADSGHLDICTLLVENGANPDPQAQIGCTPLHRAAEQGHLEVCKFLQKCGANISFQDRGKGWTPLLLAALHGRVEVCKFLLACGADVKCRNCYGESCLHMAAQPGHIELVKLLLDAGADPTVQQAYGRTAFDYAAETTSFVMLHSPLERLKKREEVCRTLYPFMTKEQKKQRRLDERVSIVIAQVPELSDPFKCRMVDYNNPSQSGGKTRVSTARPGSSRSGPSSRPSGTSRPNTGPSRTTVTSRSKATGPKRTTTTVGGSRKTTVPRGPNLTSGSRVRSARDRS